MNDLEELKSLLFGAEKQTLDSLNERVQQPETRAADIADVLPEAVRLSHRGGDSLVAELRGPVNRGLKESLQESPQEFADALYPVIGPAIRKSIMHALKSFAEQINQTMEHSLSAKGLKWRLQALRAGIPFGDFVLQQTLQYRIEQAYLISRENGLLMAHVHHDASRIKDSDAVSAMFTAIQDFVKESFSPDRSGRLETADMGEFTLWAVHGPHALMVCVIRGVPPRALRSDLSAILERIHFRYGDALRLYAGDTSSVQAVEEELTDCLQFQAQRPGKEKQSKLSIPLLVASLLIVGLVTYFAYDRWQQQQQYRRLADVVTATPGIYIGEIEHNDGIFTLHGLRDPLAASIDQIAAQSGLEPQAIQSDLQPYRSLDPEIAFLHASSIIDAPDGVSVTASDGQVVVSGRASQRWIDTLRARMDANAIGMPVSTNGLESLDWLQLEASVAELHGARFHFSRDTTLIEDDAAKLQEYAASVKALTDEASRLSGNIRITIAGFTDGSGGVEFNNILSNARTEVAENAFLAAGINSARITKSYHMSTDTLPDSMIENRRVTIELTLSHQ